MTAAVTETTFNAITKRSESFFFYSPLVCILFEWKRRLDNQKYQNQF